jgi:hypothetical protein
MHRLPAFLVLLAGYEDGDGGDGAGVGCKDNVDGEVAVAVVVTVIRLVREAVGLFLRQ